MKKGMRFLAYVMAVVMAVTTIGAWNESEVRASVRKEGVAHAKKMPFQKKNLKRTFETPSGYVIGESIFDGTEIKGVVEEGQVTYELETNLALPHAVSIWPIINYNKTDDEAYNKAIADLESSFTITKDGVPVEFYQHDDEASEFDENDPVVSEMKMKDYVDGYVKSYIANIVTGPGTYRFTFSLPKEVTEGARIYFATAGVSLNSKDTYLNSQGEQEEAAKLKVPRDSLDDKGLVGIFKKGSRNTFWYRFTLPAKRKVNFSVEGMQLTQDVAFDLTLYQPDGSTKVYHSRKDYYNTGDDDAEGWYWTGAGINRSLEKGTYYVKIQATNDADGYYFAEVDINGPSRPKVTYWALGQKVVKGTAEPGSRAYAVIGGKTYKASKKTDAKGNFTVKIPSVKAGTKIKVYIKDSSGVKSSSRTVIVKKIPKAPTAKIYKKGTKVIKGKAIAYGTVTVSYQGKKVSAKADEENDFTIKTRDTLRQGKSFKIYVRDISGNVSKVRTYKIK